MKIHSLYTLEQISLELQKVVAQLYDHGAYGLEDCRIYLKPLNDKAERIALYDAEDKPVETIDINAPEKQAFGLISICVVCSWDHLAHVQSESYV